MHGKGARVSGRFIKKRLRSPQSASPKGLFIFFYDRFGNQRGVIRKLHNCIIKISPTEQTEVCNDQSANQKKFMDMDPVGGDLACEKKNIYMYKGGVSDEAEMECFTYIYSRWEIGLLEASIKS